MVILGIIILILLVALIAAALFTRFALLGPNLNQYDTLEPVTFSFDPNSDTQKQIQDFLTENFIEPAKSSESPRQKLKDKRDLFNNFCVGKDYKVLHQPVDENGIKGEWVLATEENGGYNNDRRILYIHGGAFSVGSPASHRYITSSLAKKTGCAVFALDYRLIPEHPRMAGIEDCQKAYRWILENGPDVARPAEKLAVAGDSAGGNFTLMLSHYAETEKLRLPDCAVGISPFTDSTFASPTLKSNAKSDRMLGPLFKPLTKTPRPLVAWGVWTGSKIRPTSPLVSPLRANLANIPPTLIQASTHEMLYGDGLRYVNKARSEGGNATLQSWDHICHVWQMFDWIPEADDSLSEIAKFMAKHGVRAEAGRSAS